MAQIVLDVPDNQVARVLAAFTEDTRVAARFAASGLTAAQFTKREIATMVKARVVRYETDQAQSSNDIAVT